jgi:mannose-6-phosphate isomerase
MLYPLKFKPIMKSILWGGHKLAGAGKQLPKNMNADAPIGESWEISGVEGNVSVVANGYLKANDLQELTEVYMGDLVGEKVYERYGLEFPVLIKFIDARDTLSIQVHPDDELAAERHGTRGKTEMWYVVDCEQGAYLYVGFNREVTQEQYLDAVGKGTLSELLTRYEVRRGDVYFIPAGTVHAIGAGCLLAEIQETSDITYRIDDWGRTGADGRPRELHIEESVGAIDFSHGKEYLHATAPQPDTVREIASCPWFTTNIVCVGERMVRNHAALDSFVVYLCVAGSLTVATAEGTETLSQYESLLIPAETDEVILSGSGTLLEVFMK